MQQDGRLAVKPDEVSFELGYPGADYVEGVRLTFGKASILCRGTYTRELSIEYSGHTVVSSDHVCCVSKLVEVAKEPERYLIKIERVSQLQCYVTSRTHICKLFNLSEDELGKLVMRKREVCRKTAAVNNLFSYPTRLDNYVKVMFDDADIYLHKYYAVGVFGIVVDVGLSLWKADISPLAAYALVFDGKVGKAVLKKLKPYSDTKLEIEGGRILKTFTYHKEIQPLLALELLSR